MKNIIFDSGFYFGKGLFETILVSKGNPIFCKEHLERLNKGLEKLNIHRRICEGELEQKSLEFYREGVTKRNNAHVPEGIKPKKQYDFAIKIMVSENNVIYHRREISYTEEHYKKGFSLDLSRVKRNESSPMVYLKSFNYMDNILENQRCKAEGYNEVIFLNTKDEISEGSVSNIFFIMENEIVTPKISCGILDGVIRRKLIEEFGEKYSIRESVIKLNDLEKCLGIFVTNSLMGLMWCNYFNGICYSNSTVYDSLRIDYEELIKIHSKM